MSKELPKRKYITGQISLFSSVIVIISIAMIFTFYDFLMQFTNDLFVTTSLIVLICLPFAAANLVFTKFLTVELKDQTIFAVISYSFVCSPIYLRIDIFSRRPPRDSDVSSIRNYLLTPFFCLISLRRIDVATLDKSSTRLESR